MTQFLSGHGSFGTYLEKRKLTTTPLCSCGELDTPEHTFFSCTLIKDKLTNLSKELRIIVNKNNLLETMISNKDNWHKGYIYIKTILELKIKYFKEIENNLHVNNPHSPDVITTDGPGASSPGPL